jgi:uncharacterized surface protein with fasciclin (FAS1) repeats
MPKTPAPRATLAVTLAVALVATSSLATAAPSSAGPSSAGPEDEGMDLAVTTGYMPTFGKAVGAAGLGDVLAAPGPLTLFAPTEAAFARLAPGVLDELLRPENRARLRALLLNHVVAGNLPAASLGGGARLLTLDGGTLEVTSGANGLAVDGALVTGADVGTRNGVIHFIDRVLVPPG